MLALELYAGHGYKPFQKPRTPEEIEAAAKIIVPVLITYLKDNDPQVRLAAVESLGAFAREPDVVIPDLIKILEKEKNSNTGIRYDAISALAAYGPKAKPAVPVLLSLLKVKDPGGNHHLRPQIPCDQRAGGSRNGRIAIARLSLGEASILHFPDKLSVIPNRFDGRKIAGVKNILGGGENLAAL